MEKNLRVGQLGTSSADKSPIPITKSRGGNGGGPGLFQTAFAHMGTQQGSRGPRGTSPGFPGLRRVDTKQAPRAAFRPGRSSLIDGPRGWRPSCSRRPGVSAGPHPGGLGEEKLIYCTQQPQSPCSHETHPARAQSPST